MKYAFLLVIGIILSSCGTKVPYTNQIRDEFGLDTPQQVSKVQFYTSATIILEKNKRSGNQSTDDDGALVSSSNTNQERIIIPVGTKCKFEGFGDNDDLILRFETGQSKTISFAMREGSTSGKFYLVANWNGGSKGGDISYGNDMYTATTASATSYLQVIRKKLQKTKRKDRVVKGMKV